MNRDFSSVLKKCWHAFVACQLLAIYAPPAFAQKKLSRIAVVYVHGQKIYQGNDKIFGDDVPEPLEMPLSKIASELQFQYIRLKPASVLPTIQERTDVLEGALRAHEREIDCVWLVGFSEGGLVVVDAIRRKIVRICGVVFIAAPVFDPYSTYLHQAATAPLFGIKENNTGDDAAFQRRSRIAKAFSDIYNYGSLQNGQYDASFLKAFSEKRTNSYRSIFHGGLSVEEAEKLSFPTVFIYGERDDKIYFKSESDKITKSSVLKSYIVRCTDHLFLNEICNTNEEYIERTNFSKIGLSELESVLRRTMEL